MNIITTPGSDSEQTVGLVSIINCVFVATNKNKNAYLSENKGYREEVI